MEVKICYKCNKEKSLSDFSKNSSRKDGVSSHCKSCHKSYRKEHYERNKETIIAQVKEKKRKIREYIQNIKSRIGCSICGEGRYWVLDFHHLGDKEESVSSLVRSGSLTKVKKEIEKCEVLCSNCHRDLHHQMRKKS